MSDLTGESESDTFAQLIASSAVVFARLEDPELLLRVRRPDAGRPAPGPRLPIDPTVIDVRARAAALLHGTPPQAAEDAEARYQYRNEPNAIEEQMRRVAEATAEGRIYLARRAGHTPLPCPACAEHSVILVENEPGILECQNDVCAPIPGILRRYTVQTIGYGDPEALVSLAEAEQYTRVAAATWAERFRRDGIKPAGKRRARRTRPVNVYPWKVFAGWKDGRGRQVLTEMSPVTN